MAVTMVALLVALSVDAQAFAASTVTMAQPKMTTSDIVLNGKTLFTPDRFVAHNTTYMPIWYVIQTLKKLGILNTWNGTDHAWAVTDTAYHGGLSLNAGKGQSAISINGAVAEQKIPTLVARDPLSGVMTTFAPIWYIQQLLNHVGIGHDVWNGNTGIWSLSAATSAAPASGNTTGAVNPNTDFPNAATIARYAGGVNSAPQGVTLAKWQADVKKALAFKPTATSGIGTDPLTTSTQWYPDPHDIFYNKVFPVKDLKNGFILQKDPLVEVQRVPGASNARGGYVYVDEYVGFGNDPVSGVITWWKEEQVSVSTGQVQGVVPNLTGLAVLESKVMATVKGQGYQFPVWHGGAQPVNPTWAINTGTGVYAIPFPGWNPNRAG